MDHEYSVLGGINRARIGQVIAIVAAAVASGLVALLLALVDLAQYLGLGHLLPTVALPPIGAGLVFTALYWLFSRYVWGWPWARMALGVPDLRGTWRVDGQTINADEARSPGFVWSGKIVITQTWDKLRVRLTTTQSGSNSVTAALIRDEADGFRLFYSYRNDPKIGQPELQSHRGYAEITFDRDLTTGEGEYFNGQGRFTFGTMKLTKES